MCQRLLYICLHVLQHIVGGCNHPKKLSVLKVNLRVYNTKRGIIFTKIFHEYQGEHEDYNWHTMWLIDIAAKQYELSSFNTVRGSA